MKERNSAAVDLTKEQRRILFVERDMTIIDSLLAKLKPYETDRRNSLAIVSPPPRWDALDTSGSI